ncbi:MAG: hypothetical protein WC802_04700 [Patescibacteria group bacterium]|jgi:hypothetical protein
MNEQIIQKLLTQALTTNNKVLLGQVKEYTNQALADQSRDLREYTDMELKRTRQEILEGVGEMFDGLSPQFNNHERRILKLEKLVHAS